MSYGSELRRIRKETGLQMKETAELSGVSYNSLFKYETGKELPACHWITHDILEALGRLDELRNLLNLQAIERRGMTIELDGLPDWIVEVIVNLRACVMEDSLSFEQWQQVGELVKGECHA